MAGKIRFSFHHRVFISLLAVCWLLMGVFLVFQYQREKTFRSELLDMQLQMHNNRIIDDMTKGESLNSITSRIDTPFPELRLTLIRRDGTVIFDNNDKTPFPTKNHNDRPEIIDARKYGRGYSVGRKSESDDTDYFYSATLCADDTVIRSAAPYDHSLMVFLQADRAFLWIMLSVTLLLSLAGYFITRKISTSITNLNNFAEKASRGERIYDDWSFPHDELGSIAGNIVNLYAQRERNHREALKEEREKIRLKKQLTNNINHELKTPVASIKICAELLRDHPELPEEKRIGFINRICAATDRLNAMLLDVASITRMDDGSNAIDMETIDLTVLIREVLESEQLRTDIKITADIPQLTIRGNRHLLESIFRNLIDNAIAYSGGSEISIYADRNGNFIFRDNGSGIPDEHLHHIFERFYRIDKGRSREKGGTGLGLSIVKNAIALHGGSIKASNDSGLRFDFHLECV